MYKTIGQIIEETPKKDTITVRYNRPDLPGHIDEVTLNEEQFRYLQICIAKGEFPNVGTYVMADDGAKLPIGIDGRLRCADLNNNCLRLNDELAMKLLYVKAKMGAK